MSEVKQDLPFKLFGKTISLPANKEAAVADTTTHPEQRFCSSSTGEFCNRVDDDEDVYDHKKPSQSGLKDSDQESIHVISNQAREECKDRAPSSSMSFDKPQTPSAGKEPTSHEASKSDEQSEASVSEEKTLKKPEKIIPCPRCNSMETKFCYHNNYNVNQPRHFCKKCQRYWTAGGNMRNVPVGSGRRKSKSSCVSQYHHIMVSDSATDGIRPHGTVLAFGSDATLCQSPNNVGRNQDHPDPEAKGGNLQPLAPHVPCFQGPPWSLPWNPLQWSSAIPPGTISPSGYPMAFYPTPPYWGCGMPGTWSTSPWLSPPPALQEQAANLGKQSKDEEVLEDRNSSKGELPTEKCSERQVWMPKTLRMDDQTEAVRSSIWSSLGVKNGHHAPMSLLSQGDEKRQRFDTSLVLQANPAAFSRSLNFREAV